MTATKIPSVKADGKRKKHSRKEDPRTDIIGMDGSMIRAIGIKTMA